MASHSHSSWFIMAPNFLLASWKRQRAIYFHQWPMYINEPGLVLNLIIFTFQGSRHPQICDSPWCGGWKKWVSYSPKAAGKFHWWWFTTVKKVNKTPTKTNPRHPFFWALPSLKLTFSHLKMDGLKTSFLLGWPICRCELLILGRVIE